MTGGKIDGMVVRMAGNGAVIFDGDDGRFAPGASDPTGSILSSPRLASSFEVSHSFFRRPSVTCPSPVGASKLVGSHRRPSEALRSVLRESLWPRRRMSNVPYADVYKNIFRRTARLSHDSRSFTPDVFLYVTVC